MLHGKALGKEGVIPSGKFKGKMIVVESLWDREAFPWQADWYRSKVKENLGDSVDNHFRLWYVDHALHGDLMEQEDPTRTISYLGVLQGCRHLSDRREVYPCGGNGFPCHAEDHLYLLHARDLFPHPAGGVWAAGRREDTLCPHPEPWSCAGRGHVGWPLVRRVFPCQPTRSIPCRAGSFADAIAGQLC